MRPGQFANGRFDPDWCWNPNSVVNRGFLFLTLRIHSVYYKSIQYGEAVMGRWKLFHLGLLALILPGIQPAYLQEEKIETWDNIVFILPAGELQPDGSHKVTKDYEKWKALLKELIADPRVTQTIDAELTKLFEGSETGGEIIVTLEKGNEAAVLKDIERAISPDKAKEVKEEREARKKQGAVLPDYGQVLGGGIKIWFFADDLEGGYNSGFSEFVLLHVLLDIMSRATDIFNLRTGKNVTTFAYHSDKELDENILLMALHLVDKIINRIKKDGDLTARGFLDFVIDVFSDIPKWSGLPGDRLREILSKAKDELDRLQRGERDQRVQDLLLLAIDEIEKILKRLKKP